MVKEVGKIYKSDEYGQFTYMERNRRIDEVRKKKVRKSIQKIGYMPGAPIIVNENGEVIDGQCRLEVCKEMGLPVIYTIQPGAGIDECIAMNISATSWKMIDYIRSYAADGNKNYLYLKEQIENRPSIKPSIIAGVCADMAESVDSTVINSGNFYTDWEKLDEIEKTLNFLEEVMPTIKKMDGDTNKMCAALVFAYRHSSADISRLRKVIGDMALTAQVDQVGISTTRHALKMIENAYNNRLAQKNKVRLVVEYEDYLIGKFDWYEKKWGRKLARKEGKG